MKIIQQTQIGPDDIAIIESQGDHAVMLNFHITPFASLEGARNHYFQTLDECQDELDRLQAEEDEEDEAIRGAEAQSAERGWGLPF